MTLQPAGSEITYTVTYLEMEERPTFDWPSLPAGSGGALLKATNPPVWYFRSLYDAVGRDYSWEDMPKRPDDVVKEWLNPDTMTLWSFIEDGWPHGFFLLEEQPDHTTDLVYFGLVPEAVGKGFGTYLLRTAILTAWQRPGLKKMTVNTCTLDHPRALATYQKAGFKPVRREDKTRILARDRDSARIPQ